MKLSMSAILWCVQLKNPFTNTGAITVNKSNKKHYVCSVSD